MDRNFFRRVEVAFPINNRRLKRRVIAEGLSAFLGDNTVRVAHAKRRTLSTPQARQVVTQCADESAWEVLLLSL